MSNYQLYLDETTPVDELHFEHLEGKYISVQLAGTALTYVIFMGLALLLLIPEISPWWCIAVEGAIISVLIINMVIIPKAYKLKGYALRNNDISYRSGIIFLKTTTIPYAKIQQVSVSQNPVSKHFGLYAVELVNGAQGLSSLTIPGLNQETARQIKQIITDKLIPDND